MGTNEEIEKLLVGELDYARTAYETARKAFAEVVVNTPSDALSSGDVARMSDSAKPALSTKQTWMKALSEFSDFVLRGTIPDRFKNCN